PSRASRSPPASWWRPKLRAPMGPADLRVRHLRISGFPSAPSIGSIAIVRRARSTTGWATGLFREPALFAWLDAQPAWRLVDLDEVAAVFVRTRSAEQAGWPAVNVDSPMLFEPLDSGLQHPLDLWRRLARISILGALGRIDAARALLEQTSLLYRDPTLDALRARFAAPGAG
ncbi:MAG: hypothetical protein NTZ61_04795, partial [Proteobacteria bacterium]|nr:hypothetical protein [Pseudomonadota bacterium]